MTNKLNKNKVLYTLKHLFKVIGISETEIKGFFYDEVKHLATVSYQNITIEFQIQNIEFEDIINEKVEFKLVKSFDGRFEIPVALDVNSDFSTISHNHIKINADLINLSFILLSLYDEKATQQRDIHGRFLYEYSISKKYNIIDFPIVDEYSKLIENEINKLISIEINLNRKVNIVPSHDIDEIKRYTTAFKSIKSILADIIIYKDIVSFFLSIYTYLFEKLDPYEKSIFKLIDISKKYNLISEFYFMSSNTTNYDSGYTIDSDYYDSVISNIIKNGMIIGLHPSYYSFKDLELLSTEKQKLESSIRQVVSYNRQHFLRFDINTTLKNLDQLNFHYDTSVGFADRVGFKTGTAIPYFAYDLDSDIELKITIKPLIVMDVTLFDYMNCSEEESVNIILNLYERCKIFKGEFSILIHNNTVVRRRHWFKNVYIKFFEIANSDKV